VLIQTKLVMPLARAVDQSWFGMEVFKFRIILYTWWLCATTFSILVVSGSIR